jgi:two-component system KDP operon response regulator KdpE
MRENHLPSILLVDDEPHVLDVLRLALEGQGYRVLTARSAEHGLHIAGQQRVDVAIVDLVMPGLDGIELCRRLRAWSSLPILVLSAYGDESRKVAALDAGADDFLTKPLGTLELQARVRAAFRRVQRPEPPASVLQIGPISFDLLMYRVMLRGEPVHLTPAEFSLLKLLVVNVDRVLTHRYLLDQALGPGYDITNLRVYIRQLRQKLEADPGRPRLIVTEPGIGYRLTGSDPP